MQKIKENQWEKIYSSGEQLNKFPFSEVVAFLHRHHIDKHYYKYGLDVGCGSGIHSSLMSTFELDVLGFDQSASAIKSAKQTFNNNKIKFLNSEIEHLELGERKFDVVIDRCSSTHSSPKTVENFYARMTRHLNPGSKLYWQGFADDHSAKKLGHQQEDGAWNHFSDHIFVKLGRTCFFSEAAVMSIFKDYKILSLRHTMEREVFNDYNNSSWILELEFNG